MHKSELGIICYIAMNLTDTVGGLQPSQKAGSSVSVKLCDTIEARILACRVIDKLQQAGLLQARSRQPSLNTLKEKMQINLSKNASLQTVTEGDSRYVKLDIAFPSLSASSVRNRIQHIVKTDEKKEAAPSKLTGALMGMKSLIEAQGLPVSNIEAKGHEMVVTIGMPINDAQVAALNRSISRLGIASDKDPLKIMLMEEHVGVSTVLRIPFPSKKEQVQLPSKLFTADCTVRQFKEKSWVGSLEPPKARAQSKEPGIYHEQTPQSSRYYH